MRMIFICLVGVLVASAALPGLPSASARRGRTACDARRGSTLVEDADVRVFRRRGRTYACARPSGRAHLLRWRSTRPGETVQSRDALDVRLAGPFVAWEQLDDAPGATVKVLALMEPKRGVRAIDTQDLGFGDIDEVALNEHGTILWVKGQECGGACGQNALYEDTGGTRTMLDQAMTATQGDSGQVVRYPGIRDLGLSASGRVAFWTNDGTPKDAAIP